MTNLERVRKFLREENADLSKITLQEIRYALHDIITKRNRFVGATEKQQINFKPKFPVYFDLKQ
jgi:hypothetical protein